jgi:hypothetical protein
MKRRGTKKRRVLLWLLALAAVAGAAAVWTMPESRREALLAEAGRRVAPWRDAVEKRVAEMDIRLPRLAEVRRRIGVDGDGGGDGNPDDGRRGAVAGDGDTRPAVRGDGTDGKDISRVEIVDGVPTVRLDQATQAQSGVATQVLGQATFAPEIAAFGRVMDLQPFVELRARFDAAKYTAETIRPGLVASEQEVERLRALHKDEHIIATKRLQEAEARWKRERAELRRIEAERRAVRDEARQEWGPELSGSVLGDSETFERLLARKDVLLLVTLPVGKTLPENTRTVLVSADGNRDHARPAHYVSAAPYTDPVIQGETYFFRTGTGRLRSDMRVDVWVEQSELSAVGVIVPQPAVIWATGQAWAYVKVDDEHFARRPVPTEVEAPGGWFVKDSIRPGEHLVISGAQMLYAEEFRWQIRNEDED